MVKTLGTMVRPGPSTAARSSIAPRMAEAISTGWTSALNTLANGALIARSRPRSTRSTKPTTLPSLVGARPRAAQEGQVATLIVLGTPSPGGDLAGVGCWWSNARAVDAVPAAGERPAPMREALRPRANLARHSREWRNRQTRTVQVRVPERAWGFNSPLAHVTKVPVRVIWPGPSPFREDGAVALLDDTGVPLARVRPTARRVVSLVPSLTEAIAATRPEALCGATDWCTHPADLDVTRVRGTKNVDWRTVVDLKPDLVVANKEENRELDVRRLRDSRVPVWVTVIEDVPQALTSMGRLFTDALGWDEPEWLSQVRATWDRPVPAPHTRVAVPIWRDPWMVVGSATYTGDLLA